MFNHRDCIMKKRHKIIYLKILVLALLAVLTFGTGCLAQENSWNDQPDLIIDYSSRDEQDFMSMERTPDISSEEFQKRRQRWENMSEERKKRIKKRYQKFQKLSVNERNELRKNWQRYRGMSKEKKEALRKKFKNWENLSFQEKARTRRHWRHYRNLSPEQKKKVREKRRKWQGLS